MSHIPEEATKVGLIQVVVGPVIYGFKGSWEGEVIGGLKDALKVFTFKLESNFLEQEGGEGFFNSGGEKFVAGDFVVGTLSSGGAEGSVVTGEE